MRSALISVLASILLGACAPLAKDNGAKPPQQAATCPACPVCVQCPPPKPAAEAARYVATVFDALPGWGQASLAASLRAFTVGCPRAMVRLCEQAAAVPAADEARARAFFESNFLPYAIFSTESGDAGLITGYYEPLLEGSRVQTARHRFPLYAVPEDLIVVDLATASPETRNLRLRGRLQGRRLVPYFTRAEIEARGGAFPAPVLAWAADPVELFFLQIQGSGQMEIDGRRVRMGYADQNGHPYRSLGRYLVDRGELPLEQASMQGIKTWAAANPAKLQEALNYNASYVFFRELEASGGPIGALGVPLTAEYSLAVDRRFVPLGAPVYLDTTRPLSAEPLQRLMAAQDTGGAIRGAVRADFFWGTGADAGANAGRMRQQGRMWLLWPRDMPLPAQD